MRPLKSPIPTHASLLCGLVAAALLSTQLFAQTDDGEVEKTGDEPSLPAQSPVLIRDVGGQVVAEPVDVVSVLPEGVAPAFISRLEFDGQVVGSVAELTAEIDIALTRDNVWEQVALRMPEARITNAQYFGEGRNAPVVDAEQTEGLVWTFRGQGTHRLVIQLSVPVRRAPDGQQIQLTLPRLPKIFDSKFSLRVPDAPLEARREGGDVQVSQIDEGAVLIQTKMPGVAEPGTPSKLTLSWSKPSEVAPGTVSSVQTDLALRIDPERGVVRLDADQKIVTVEQSTNAVRVRAPSAFDIEGDGRMKVAGSRYREHRVGVDSSGNQVINVQLQDEASNQADLHWIFERELLEEETTVVIDGLDLELAQNQATRVTILPADGYRLSVDWDSLEGGSRAAPIDPAGLASVEIGRHPFQVPVRIRKERPSISVSPRSDITLTDSQAHLDTEFVVAVDRGQVDELTIDWAQSRDAGWKDLRVVSPSDARLRALGDKSIIDLQRPRNSDFTVVIAGSRVLNADPNSSFELPRLLAETESPTQLRVFATDAVTASVSGEYESRLLPRLTPIVDQTDRKREAVREIGSYTVLGEPAVIAVEREVRKSIVRATSSVNLAPRAISGSQELALHFSQTIDVDVEYGRRPDILLSIPRLMRAGEDSSAVANDLRFRLNGRPFPRERISPAGDDAIRLSFDDPLGAFTLGIETSSISFAPNDRVASVPVVRVLGVKYDSLRCHVQRNAVVSMRPIGPASATEPYLADGQSSPLAFETQWDESPVSTPNSVTWSLVGPAADVEQIDLAMSRGVSRTDAVFGIRRIESQVTREVQSANVRAEFDLYQMTSGVVIAVPIAAEGIRFTWNGIPIKERESAPPDDHDFPGWQTYRIPRSGQSTGQLSVDYRIPLGRPGLVDSVSVPLPLLPQKGVWIDQEAAVEILISDGQYLFVSPHDLSRRFRWIRQGLVWTRVSERRVRFADQETAGTGRPYLFSATVLPSQIEFTSADGSFLVFAGTAVTFLGAFILYTFPRTRRLPTLLGVGLCLAVFGVVNGELLQVLFQPALLGVLASMLAVVIDQSRRKNRPARPVVAVVSESEYSVWNADHSELDSAVSETVVRQNPPHSASRL